jgi:hypothetical protein
MTSWLDKRDQVIDIVSVKHACHVRTRRISMKLTNSSLVMRVGMAFFLAASLWKWFVHPTPFLSADWSDGICGMLYGLAIGTMLMSLRLQQKKRREAGSC